MIASVEILSFTPQSGRADSTLAAIARAALLAKVRVTTSRTYQGGSTVLVLWGPGAPDRWPAMAAQRAAGGHVACWDLAYWQRDTKVRVSIDAAHPQAWVLKHDWPASRLRADGIVVRNDWHPDGPVLVAGLGAKAMVQYGAAVAPWEAARIAEARQRGRVVHYRSKQGADGPIEQALRGAALVCTWHSNVAIDAIRAGIPVICRDGAAAAVCPSSWPDPLAPVPEAVRDRFLSNLAWFQWDLPREAAACWTWLTELLA